MRCIACNTPFHATLSTDLEGNPFFATHCGACIVPKSDSHTYCHDYICGVEESPLVMVAKEQSISTQDLY